MVRGFDRDGDVIVNDPAQPAVRHVYPRAAFARCWLDHGGVALLVAPAERIDDLLRVRERVTHSRSSASSPRPRSPTRRCTSSWSNPRSRRTPATSRACARRPAARCIWSNRWGSSIDDRALKRAGLDYWHAVRLVVHPSLDAFLADFPAERCWWIETTGADALRAGARSRAATRWSSARKPARCRPSC